MEDYDVLEVSDEIRSIIYDFGIPKDAHDQITSISMALIDTNPHLSDQEKKDWKLHIYSPDKISKVTQADDYTEVLNFVATKLPVISPGLIHDFEVWRYKLPREGYTKRFLAFSDLIDASGDLDFEKIRSILKTYPDLINEDMGGGIRTKNADTMLNYLLMGMDDTLHNLETDEEVDEALKTYLDFLKFLKDQGANFQVDRRRNLLGYWSMNPPETVKNFPKFILFIMDAMKPQTPPLTFLTLIENNHKEIIDAYIDAYTDGENYPKLTEPKRVFKSCDKDIWFGEKCSQCSQIPIKTLRKIAIQLNVKPTFHHTYLCLAVATKIANLYNDIPNSLVVAFASDDLTDWSLKTIEPHPRTIGELDKILDKIITDTRYYILMDNEDTSGDPHLIPNESIVVLIRPVKFPYRVRAGSLSILSLDPPKLAELLIFDPIMVEEVPLQKYLDEDEDNIAFIILSQRGEIKSAQGYTRSQLNDEMDNLEFFYECKTSQLPSLETIEQRKPYMQIKGVITAYVPATEVLAVLKSKDQSVFALFPSDEYLDRSASISTVQVDWGYNFLDQEIDVISADHCQDGTRKQKWNILVPK